MRSSGVIAARPNSAQGGNPPADLLIAYGRNPDWIPRSPAGGASNLTQDA
jgi:hypothetical protein